MVSENTKERGEIIRLMTLPDDTLLTELASGAHGALPQDALKRGTQILTRLRKAAQDAICRNDEIKQLAQDGDTIALVGAIADLLATQFDVTPAATVAVLLVRSRVTDYCSAHWSPGDGDAADR